MVLNVTFAFGSGSMNPAGRGPKTCLCNVKEAIISLKKKKKDNKPIRETAKTLAVANTTVWKEGINWQLSNGNRPKIPR